MHLAGVGKFAPVLSTSGAYLDFAAGAFPRLPAGAAARVPLLLWAAAGWNLQVPLESGCVRRVPVG